VGLFWAGEKEHNPTRHRWVKTFEGVFVGGVGWLVRGATEDPHNSPPLGTGEQQTKNAKHKRRVCLLGVGKKARNVKPKRGSPSAKSQKRGSKTWGKIKFSGSRKKHAETNRES